MWIRFWTIWTLLVVAALVYAETPKPPVAPTPTLSTADKIAIESCERAKQDAQKQYQDAETKEIAVEREWAAVHPGFQINSQTFAVEAIPEVKPVATSAPAATPTPAKVAEPKK